MSESSPPNARLASTLSASERVIVGRAGAVGAAGEARAASDAVTAGEAGSAGAAHGDTDAAHDVGV